MKRNISSIFIITSIFVFSLGILNYSYNSYGVNKPNYNNITICIDPGHQSKGNAETEPIAPGSKIKKAKVSSGTTGVFTKVPEYKLNLKISLKLRDKLKSEGFKVIMTRETNDVNISNIERAEIANKAKSDISIRIHADGSTDKNMHGVSILYPASGQVKSEVYIKSKTAASRVMEAIINSTSAKFNGIIARTDLTGFNWTKVPSILIETGFMTNVNEDKMLEKDEYENKIVQGIVQGVEDYFNSQSKGIN